MTDVCQLTASGDQTTRIHTLDTPVPRLQAILRGHTSSIKTTVFFDPSRSHLDPSVSSSVVASSGRDGNILIYDLRCQGQSSLHGSDLLSPTRRTRSRYSEGVSGFSAQTDAPVLDPVMIIRGAHGDGIRRPPPTQVSTADRPRMSEADLLALCFEVSHESGSDAEYARLASIGWIIRRVGGF